MEKIFTNIYENKVWGDNKNNDYNGSSGGGSDVNYNIDSYIPFLKNFISNNDIKSVVDLGCGDFRCGPLIYDNLNVLYTGYDTYEKVIKYNKKNKSYNFIHLDIFNNKEELINGDLCIMKDILQHWSLSSIYSFLDYLVESCKYRYILLCNCSNQTRDDTDIIDGEARPLNIDYLPLKKYGFKRIFTYHTKEVSILDLNERFI